MTDDRARRIRDLRKRTAGSNDDDDTDDEPEDAAAGDDDATADAAGDEPVKTDGNGDTEATADGDAQPEDGGAADEGADATDTTEPDVADDVATPDADAATEETTDSSATETVADARSDDESTPEVGGTHQPAQRGTQDGGGIEETADPSQSAGSAEPTAAQPQQTQPTTGGGRSTRAGSSDGLTPMVEAADVSDSPFGGAVASDDVLGDFVDDVGTDELDTMSSGADGRSASVFDRDDSLVTTSHETDTVQMLEFYLNEDRHAIEIERISAIVEMKQITRFPRGPDAIDGVTDLRGEITAVLDPTAMLDVERNELSDDQYIVVLERDDDKQKLGFRVTDVLQAVTYRESQIDETASVMDAAGDSAHEFVNGIVKKTTDGRTELVTWIDVDSIIENTE